MLKEWKGGGEVRDKKEGRAVEGLHVIYVCVSICVSMCVCVCPSTSEVPDIGRCVLLQCVKALQLQAVSRHWVWLTEMLNDWLVDWWDQSFIQYSSLYEKKKQQQPVKIVNYRAVFICFIGFYSPCTSHNHRPTGLLHLVINLLYCSDLSSSNQSKSALELMRWSSLC